MIISAKEYKPSAPGIFFTMLSLYPAFLTVGILLSGLFKSRPFALVMLLSWVIVMLFGIITWIGLMLYLLIKGKMSMKRIALNAVMTASGSIAAYYVIQYDILGSGAKYID